MQTQSHTDVGFRENGAGLLRERAAGASKVRENVWRHDQRDRLFRPFPGQRDIHPLRGHFVSASEERVVRTIFYLPKHNRRVRTAFSNFQSVALNTLREC